MSDAAHGVARDQLRAFVERIGVRPALKTRSEFGWIMATIALGIIFKNVAENIWGRDDLRFPSPLPEAPIEVPAIMPTVPANFRICRGP